MTNATDTNPEALAQRALDGGERPPLADPLSASITYGWRVLLKIKHVPEELGDAVGTRCCSRFCSPTCSAARWEGSTHAYLQYLLPGTLVLAVVLPHHLQAASTLNRDLTTGAFDRFRSLPVWRPAPLVGSLLGDVGRYRGARRWWLVLGFIMGFDAGGGVLGVLAGVAWAIVFALSLSWAWLALGFVLRSPSAVMSIGFVVLMPLAFMSNIFVDVATLPSWRRTFTEINPITHVVTAERGLIHGHVHANQIGWALLATAALTAIFMPLALYLQGRRVCSFRHRRYATSGVPGATRRAVKRGRFRCLMGYEGRCCPSPSAPETGVIYARFAGVWAPVPKTRTHARRSTSPGG